MNKLALAAMATAALGAAAASPAYAHWERTAAHRASRCIPSRPTNGLSPR